jgi:hypothetical protein
VSFVTKLVIASPQLLTVAVVVLAGTIALSPTSSYPTQTIRECVWNGHVVLCRFREGDPPELAKQHRSQPTPLPPAG